MGALGRNPSFHLEVIDMRLFIAEKKEVATAIAAALGQGRSHPGFIDCPRGCVTWASGHLLALLDPEDYDPRYRSWRLEDLPVANIPWRRKPSGDARSKEQLNVIMGLLKKATEVVHAGDSDEEGQLIVDEILTYANVDLPVQRVLINDLNDKLVRRALDNMRSNSEALFVGMSRAAEARSVGDQLYGYNLTRALTTAARAKGYDGVISAGRVQTPILGLVVRRTRANRGHEKAVYYTVKASLDFEACTFEARFCPGPTDPVDDSARINDGAFAEQLATSLRGCPAVLESTITKPIAKSPPLPYNLLKLQTDASRKFGLTPKAVMEITQALRDKHRLITYNRTDCEYLSAEHHADAPLVLDAIRENIPSFQPIIARADTKLISRAFNSSKVGTHHAIIPTEATVVAGALSDSELKIYMLVARAYMAQFFPLHRFDQTELRARVDGHAFSAKARVVTVSGWRSLYTNDIGNEDLETDVEVVEVDLRALREGSNGRCSSVSATREETRPPSLYTIATLFAELPKVAKYIRDEKLRKVMIEKDAEKEGEHAGIGTAATRHAMIDTLFDRGYLQEKGKAVVPTAIGEQLYDALPDEAKFPDMTAIWQEQQNDIRRGVLEVRAFVHGLMDYIAREVDKIRQHGVPIKVDTHPCPTCGAHLRRLASRDRKGAFFWGCSNFAAGCKYSCSDQKGKPVPREQTVVSTLHRCMACGSGLVARSGKEGRWWGCSAYPTCKQTYKDAAGKPDYSKGRAG